MIMVTLGAMLAGVAYVVVMFFPLFVAGS